jgi:hypothetical protein
MKSLKLRVGLLCLTTMLVLGLSNVIAAACADVEAGGNAYGDYDCRFKAACGGWCYYECTCSNVFPGHTCEDVLEEAGFEMVQSVPCNT